MPSVQDNGDPGNPAMLAEPGHMLCHSHSRENWCCLAVRVALYLVLMSFVHTEKCSNVSWPCTSSLSGLRHDWDHCQHHTAEGESGVSWDSMVSCCSSAVSEIMSMAPGELWIPQNGNVSHQNHYLISANHLVSLEACLNECSESMLWHF